MTNVDELDKLAELEEKLKQLNDKINQYDIPRTNFSAILEDENLLSIYHKEWNIINKQIRLVRLFRNYFLKHFESNPELMLSKIKTHLNKIMELMQLFDPKEISKLQHAILMLSKLEINELNECIEDVERWPNYRLTNRIDFFTQRLMLYLKGGRDEIYGKNYLGLVSHFKDKELVRNMFEIPKIKKLWTYKQEMQFFKWASDVVLKSLKEGGWEGFFEFYKNLRKGKNYIRIVRQTFGNEEFANFLEALDEKIHESPEIWKENLAELNYRLNNIVYQNMQVIQPAANELLTLFSNAINIISNSKVEFHELGNILSRLEKNIEKRLKILREHIEEIKNKFNKVDAPLSNELSVVVPQLIDYMYRIRTIPTQRLTNINNSLGTFSLWLKKYKIDIQRYLTRPIAPGVTFFDAVQADKLAIMKSQLINTPLISTTFDFSIKTFEIRINSKLIPLLEGVIGFIRKYENVFIMPISNTKELLPQVQELLSKQYDEVANQFKKEGIDLTKPLYG